MYRLPQVAKYFTSLSPISKHRSLIPLYLNSLHLLIKQMCFRSFKWIFHSCIWWGRGRIGRLTVAASTCKPTIPRMPGKVVPTNRWRLLLGGLSEGAWQRRGTVRACDSLCDFAHVVEGDPHFFSSVCTCVWDVCGWGRGVKGRIEGMAAQLKMFKICWPDRVSQDRLVNGVFWKVLSCSFNEPQAKKPNEACSVCQNSPSAWPSLTCATPTPLEGGSPWWPA